MKKSNKIILIDADVISHFIVCSDLIFLPKILEPHSIAILENVYTEISRLPQRKQKLDFVLNTVKNISKMNFPESLEIKKEYSQIKKNNPLIGDGERACMAVAKFNKNIVASSNFKDIKPYCLANNIYYLGTLDILTIALNKGIFTEEQCYEFITTAKSKNKARFPVGVNFITDYKAPDLSFLDV